MSEPVSAEAKGRVRTLWSALEREAARMTTAIGRVPAKILNSRNWKGPVGAERAIAKIVAALPVPPELRTPSKAVWRFLQPSTALPTANDQERSGFVMMAIIAGPRNRLVRAETFGVAFTLHSIGRLLDRSGFRLDPLAAMTEAHSALTRLPQPEGHLLFDLADAQVPAGGGIFLASPGRFGPNSAPLAICKTWLSRDDRLHGTEARNLEAWRTLLDQPVS